MPSFNILKKTDIKNTFRVMQVKGGFDINEDKLIERFEGDINIENTDWNIGLIVGRSGTGKTSIINELYGERKSHTYGEGAIVDEMPKNSTFQNITMTFTSVGFSSPPSWLKPYRVLSTGEKMRVDLAYAILSDENPIIFDEFTSVVDRNIAKICSCAISKNVRKLRRQFIGISCHEDIIEWLSPDWVFDTNLMKFSFRDNRKRPDIKLEIYKVENKKDTWEIFRKYHYLNSQLHIGADAYVACLDDVPVSFVSLMKFPHAVNKNIWRVHRWVTLPDYQGVGIGTALLNNIAERYKKLGRDVRLVSSQVNVMKGLKKGWVIKHYGRVTPHLGLPQFQKCASTNRNTMSLKYIGVK
jgi:ABC-type lipoprotein export system ATPase subunit/GNAT superfamily N-acetyltransferase